MITFMKKLWRDRRGNALIIAAGAMPLVFGAAGLASDTIQWTMWKRQLQRLADSGAIAGVYAEAAGQAVGTCSSISTATYADPVAYDIKSNNKLKVTPSCTLTNPPSSGTYASDPYAVQVTLSVQKRLNFSAMFMSSPPTITADATATIIPSGDYCVISLESTSSTGITATGATNVDLGCGMITNSTSMEAAVATGSSIVKATPVAAVGGIDNSDNWATGTVLQPFTLAQSDPFANVSPPTTGSCSNFPATNDLDFRTDAAHASGQVVCYKSDMHIQGDVKLGAATYVLDAASIKMTSTSASLSCSGCTIILTTSGTDMSKIGGVDIQGGKLDLTAPDTGPYKGIAIYQDRRATFSSSATNTINGNSSSKIQGAIYFPNQQVTFAGTSGMSTACMQLVARQVKFTGSSAISNSCPSGSGSGSFKGKRVRLVA